MLSGRSAAVLWNVDLAGPEDDVECTLDPGCRAGSLAGVRVTRRALAPEEITRRAGVRVTSALRTALDLARIEPLEESVVCLDRFLRAGLLTLGQLRAAAAEVHGPGAGGSDERCTSPKGWPNRPRRPGSG